MASEPEMFQILELIVQKTHSGELSWDESGMSRGTFTARLGPYVLQLGNSMPMSSTHPELVLKRSSGKTVETLGGYTGLMSARPPISSPRVQDGVKTLWKLVTDNTEDVKALLTLLK